MPIKTWNKTFCWNFLTKQNQNKINNFTILYISFVVLQILFKIFILFISAFKLHHYHYHHHHHCIYTISIESSSIYVLHLQCWTSEHAVNKVRLWGDFREKIKQNQKNQQKYIKIKRSNFYFSLWNYYVTTRHNKENVDVGLDSGNLCCIFE